MSVYSIPEPTICFYYCQPLIIADMLLQFSEGLLKTPPTGERGTCSDDADDRHSELFADISTPSTTVGTEAAKIGARCSLVDISLTNLRTELRNIFAGLRNKQLSKGLTCSLGIDVFDCEYFASSTQKLIFFSYIIV